MVAYQQLLGGVGWRALSPRQAMMATDNVRGHHSDGHDQNE
jgi:hypothetical protein